MADRAHARGRLHARPPWQEGEDGGAIATCVPSEPVPVDEVEPDSGYASGVSEMPPSLFDDDSYDEGPFEYAWLGFDDGDREALQSGPVPRPQFVLPALAAHAERGGRAVAHGSHRLRQTSQIVWCQICGRFAI